MPVISYPVLHKPQLEAVKDVGYHSMPCRPPGRFNGMMGLHFPPQTAFGLLRPPCGRPSVGSTEDAEGLVR